MREPETPAATSEPEAATAPRTPLRTTAGTIREAIERSGLFSLAAEQHPDVNVSRGSTHVWTAELGGRRHAATLYGVPGVQVPAVTALADALAAADA